MVTFAQAQERAEEWINGDLPPYQHQEVRVREFALGFVAWAEGREGGPTADAGRQRLVVARDSGEATLWPGLPVGEVIRRYEEEYGVAEAPVESAPPVPPDHLAHRQPRPQRGLTRIPRDHQPLPPRVLSLIHI